MDFETTFNTAASDYDGIRPGYPQELYTDLLSYKPLTPESQVLEIGLGTGKATATILDTGCRLTGLEPGDDLTAIAKERLSGRDNFTLLTEAFQDYICPAGSFDLVYAATAFHWIPEEYGYRRVYELLKPGGAFARFAYHAGPDVGRPELRAEVDALYEKHMGFKSTPPDWEQKSQQLAALAEKYGFTATRYHLYHREKHFTAGEYMRLLRTYPDHMKLEEHKRQQLFEGIFQAINRYGGTMTVYYTFDMELARK